MPSAPTGDRLAVLPAPGDFVRIVSFDQQPHLVGLIATVVACNAEAGTVQILVSLSPNHRTNLILDTSQVDLHQQVGARVHSEYRWVHCQREGKVVLYMDQTVSFAHLDKGKMLEMCEPHGTWRLQGDTLTIDFHHQAVRDWARRHVFTRLHPQLDCWQLAGCQDPVKWCVLAPW